MAETHFTNLRDLSQRRVAQGSGRPQGSSPCTCGSCYVWCRHETPSSCASPPQPPCGSWKSNPQVQIPSLPGPVPSSSPQASNGMVQTRFTKLRHLLQRRTGHRISAGSGLDGPIFIKSCNVKVHFFIALAKLDESHTSIMKYFLC